MHNKKEIDFIIVGSGPGGATVAKELSHRKKKVCILEWGDNDPFDHSGGLGITAHVHNYWTWETFGKISFG